MIIKKEIYICDLCECEVKKEKLKTCILPLKYSSEICMTDKTVCEIVDLCEKCRKLLAYKIYEEFGVYFQNYVGVMKEKRK